MPKAIQSRPKNVQLPGIVLFVGDGKPKESSQTKLKPSINRTIPKKTTHQRQDLPKEIKKPKQKSKRKVLKCIIPDSEKRRIYQEAFDKHVRPYISMQELLDKYCPRESITTESSGGESVSFFTQHTQPVDISQYYDYRLNEVAKMFHASPSNFSKKYASLSGRKWPRRKLIELGSRITECQRYLAVLEEAKKNGSKRSDKIVSLQSEIDELQREIASLRSPLIMELSPIDEKLLASYSKKHENPLPLHEDREQSAGVNLDSSDNTNSPNLTSSSASTTEEYEE